MANSAGIVIALVYPALVIPAGASFAQVDILYNYLSVGASRYLWPGNRHQLTGRKIDGY